MSIKMVKKVEKPLILLVEDSPADQLIVERAIEDAGIKCRLVIVEHGKQALELLANASSGNYHEEQALPDLVLMDINMPIMDGITTLKNIRSDPRLHNMPVVMLTTSDAPHDVEASYADGANAYVTKPVQEKGFVDVMNKLDYFWFQLATLPAIEND